MKEPELILPNPENDDGNIYDLSLGTDYLIHSLEKRYPGIGSSEIETLGNALLGKIGDSIVNGENIGSVNPTPEGKMEFKIWEFGQLGNDGD